MKIIAIADLHLGSKDLVKDSHVRSASSVVDQNLATFIDSLKKHEPELIIDLGDLIRSENPENDLANYKNSFNQLSKVNVPRIHLIGNHELKKLDEKHITSCWTELGHNEQPFGIKEFDEITVVWISFENQNINGGIEAVLPAAQLEWLSQALTSISKPIYLFTHYAIFVNDYAGNFLFDGEFKRFGVYNNNQDILKVVKGSNVKAVFSAHAHWIDLSYWENIPFVTLPSVTENIAAPDASNNFPGVFSVLDPTGTSATVKVYSADYCFCSLHI